jgi:AAA family ATP:ADP antiporter
MAVVLSAQVFLLMAAHYVLKAARDALVLAEAGPEVKSYAAAGQAVLLLAVIPLYGWLLARVSPLRFACGLTLASVGSLVLFASAGRSGFAVGVPFYLWVGIFGVSAVAQFWAFASDVYSEEQGKRLFPVLGIGSAVGGFAGAQLASATFRSLGPYALMLAAAGLLLVSLLLVALAPRFGACRREKDCLAPEPVKGGRDGLQLVLSSRYLSLIAAMVVLLNMVNTTGEFVLSKLAVEQAALVAVAPEAREQFLGSFYAGYYTWTTLMGALVQVLLAARVLRWAGAGGALLILPVIALGGYAAFAAVPALAIAKFTKVLENSAEYSIANTARHALLLPANREAKYKAKAAIETFFVRAGDVLQAGVVMLGSQLALNVAQYAWVNVGLATLWLAVVAALYREHRRVSAPKTGRIEAHRTPCRRCPEPPQGRVPLLAS